MLELLLDADCELDELLDEPVEELLDEAVGELDEDEDVLAELA